MADYSITPANVKALGGSTVQWGIAGNTIAAGEGIYEDPTTGTLKLCRGDNAATVIQANLKGIAIAGAAIGQPVPYVSAGPVQLAAIPSYGVAGSPVLVSINAGKLCPYSDLSNGEYVTIAGFIDVTETKLLVTISRYEGKLLG